jgi:hypothetical protein
MDERDELERRRRSRKRDSRGGRRRAAVIVMLADGASFTAINAVLGCFPDYINRWRQRFEHEGLAGLRASGAGNGRACARQRSRGASWPRRARRRPTAARTGARANSPRVMGVSHGLIDRCVKSGRAAAARRSLSSVEVAAADARAMPRSASSPTARPSTENGAWSRAA